VLCPRLLQHGFNRAGSLINRMDVEFRQRAYILREKCWAESWQPQSGREKRQGRSLAGLQEFAPG
jgi:hypothetical protein